MLSVRAIYDGRGGLKFRQKVKIRTPKEVIVTFLDPTAEKETPNGQVHVDDIQVAEIHEMLLEGGALDFLNDEEEDIYSDDDLKVKY